MSTVSGTNRTVTSVTGTRKARLKTCNFQDNTFYVFQQGRAGGTGFFDEGCFRFYLTRLLSCLKAYRQQLHTYALLPNELHLLVSAFSGSGLLRMMATVNTGYQEYFNNRFSRNSPLGSGVPVCRRLAGGNLVLDCQKYIELAPVRKKLASVAGEYPWTGYTVNAFGGHGATVVAHRQYRSMWTGGGNSFQQYRDFISRPFSASQERFLEQRLRSGFPLVPLARVPALRSAGPESGSMATAT